jgi:hypothetical protein
MRSGKRLGVIANAAIAASRVGRLEVLHAR